MVAALVMVVSTGHIAFLSSQESSLLVGFSSGAGEMEEVTAHIQKPDERNAQGGAFYRQGAFFSYLGQGGEDPVIPLITSDMAIVEPLQPLTIEAGDNSREDVIAYEVQEGDNPSTIAAKFGITTQTLLWANKLEDGDFIRPGDKLLVLPVSGVMHKVKSGDTVTKLAKRYRAEEEKILAFNDLSADIRLRAGDTLVIPDGEMPVPASSPASPRRSGFASLPSAGKYFIFPTTGRNWGRIHGRNGVDIANSCGASIHAAAAGSVTLADPKGWNYGYGRYVVLTHANRTSTLYAHLSSLTVSFGQSVERGQLLGYMGTTGRSSGCHLHFEVHGARNPLAR